MIIGLDLDEVCCDLATNMCNFISDTYEIEHNHEVFSNYDFHENEYTESADSNIEIANDLATQASNLKFLLSCKPIVGAAEAVAKLKYAGNEVHIITARTKGEEAYTYKWLRRYGFSVDSVIHIGHDSSKGIIGKEMGLDVFVDDHIYNIESMLEHSNAKVYLITRPWNVDYSDDRVTRINHVADLLDEINYRGD